MFTQSNERGLKWIDKRIDKPALSANYELVFKNTGNGSWPLLELIVAQVDSPLGHVVR